MLLSISLVLFALSRRAITECLLLHMSKALRMYYHFSSLSPSAQKKSPTAGGMLGFATFWKLTGNGL